jgi:hypothetical protein
MIVESVSTVSEDDYSFATREKLEEAVKPLDDIFKQRMKPSTFMSERIPPPPMLKGRPYFWETNAII